MVALLLTGIALGQTAALKPSPPETTDAQGVKNQSQKQDEAPQNPPVVIQQIVTNEGQPKANSNTEGANNQTPQGWMAILWNKAIADPIAVLTVGLLFFAAYQAWLTRDTAKRQLRAYVVIKDNVLKSHQIAADGKMSIQVTTIFTNTGQTPAYKVRIVSRLKIMTFEEAGKFDSSIPPLEDASVSTLGTNAASHSPSPRGSTCSRKEFDEICLGTEKRLFVYGIITYRDAFKKRRYSRFCDSFVMTGGILKATPFKTGQDATNSPIPKTKTIHHRTPPTVWASAPILPTCPN